MGLPTTKDSTRLRVRLVIGALVFLAIVAGVLFAIWVSRPRSVHTSGVAITAWIEYRQFPGGEAAEYQLRIHNEGLPLRRFQEAVIR